jgi:uncharacterized membrane protein YedE/YeeE
VERRSARKSIDVNEFTPWTALLGGALIGLASASVFWLQGRLAGISGICGQLFAPVRGDFAWRLLFVLGLAAVGACGVWLAPQAFSTQGTPPLPIVAASGVLVGFGTRLANGCTSGHGVCGVSRVSPRSIAATFTFMGTGALAVFVLRHLIGGL